jgi:hypothetical protein
MLPKLSIDPTGAPPGRRGSRRWLVGLMIVSLPVAVLAVVWGTIQSRITQRLNRAMAQAETMDPGRWRLADVWGSRAAVPDAENGALVVVAAARALPPNWSGELNTSLDGRFRPGDLLKRLGDAREAITAPLSPEETADVRAELAALRPALEAARSLAIYPSGRPPTTLAPVFFATKLPYQQNSAWVVNRLLTLDAALRAADRDTDGAVDDVRAMVNTGRSIGDEPIATSQLVRIGLVDNALEVLQRVLAQGEASDEALRELDELLAIEEREPIVEWAMMGERAGLFDTFQQLADGRLPFNKFVGMLGAAPPKLPISPPRTLFRYEQSLGLEEMNEVLAASRLPLREQPVAWASWKSKMVGLPPRTIVAGPTWMIINTAWNLADTALNHAAKLAAARTLIAAERHHLAHGSWPETIDDLVPEFLAAPPADPFGSGTLILRRDAEGLVVYSIGADGRDNEGRDLRPKRRDNQGRSDVGYRLYDPLQRRRPAGRIAPLPDDPFARPGP